MNNKFKIIIIVIISVIFSNCNNENSSNNPGQIGNVAEEHNPKQLNISILLDLSDRLIQDLVPNQVERDISIIETIIKIFKEDMKLKGNFLAKGKIKILFDPLPKDPEIARIANELTVDLSNSSSKEKKLIYDSIDSMFRKNLFRIYNFTLKSKNWIGSDIWRFFKNDVEDLCIDKNSNYRNILVIITDGYIYHKQSIEKMGNRYSFVTGKLLENLGLRNNLNWIEKFNINDYGLITTRNNLENLEVLVLEVNSPTDNKMDEDILKAFLNKWFKEMNVKRVSIFNTDLPINTSNRIINFLNSY